METKQIAVRWPIDLIEEAERRKGGGTLAGVLVDAARAGLLPPLTKAESHELTRVKAELAKLIARQGPKPKTIGTHPSGPVLAPTGLRIAGEATAFNPKKAWKQPISTAEPATTEDEAQRT